MFEDSNVILEASEKQGGTLVENSAILEFQQFLSYASLRDLGFVGCSFTWSNM